MLILLVALAPPLAGAPFPELSGEGDTSCSYKQAAAYLQAHSDHYVAGNRALVDESILLMQLEGSQVTGERVYFDFLLNGERHLLEEVVVREDDMAAALGFEAPALERPVVELLGGEPGLRARLRTAAAQGEDVRVVVYASGLVVADRRLADIVAASDHLRTDGPLPVATERSGTGSRATSTAAWSGGALPPSKSCQSNCGIVQDLCYDECVFTPGGGSSCFAACDAEYGDCINGCNGGGGGCNPSSTSTSQDTVVSQTAIGPVRCLRFPVFNFLDDYIRTRERNRRVTTTVTTNADCSQTTSTTTSFFNTFCWDRFSPGCTAPFLPFAFFCDP